MVQAPAGGGGMSDLTRVTVNLRPRAMRALDALTADDNADRTDAVNAALVLVHHLRTHAANGVLSVVGRDGTRVEVILP